MLTLLMDGPLTNFHVEVNLNYQFLLSFGKLFQHVKQLLYNFFSVIWINIENEFLI
jgi:hypothetical protein